MSERTRTTKGNVILMVGTRKGEFILSSDKSRKSWSLSGPFFEGHDNGDHWELLIDYLPPINSVASGLTA